MNHLRTAWAQRIAGDRTHKEIYVREMAARSGMPILTLEAATSLLQAVLRREGAPQADEAYVQRGSEPNVAMTGWDHGTRPPIPFIHAGPGTPDALTVVHEAAHIIVNAGRMGVSWEAAHGPDWEMKFLKLLAYWAPDAARKMGPANEDYPPDHVVPPLWGKQAAAKKVWRHVRLYIKLADFMGPNVLDVVKKALAAGPGRSWAEPHPDSGLGVHWSADEWTARVFEHPDAFVQSMGEGGYGPAMITFPVLIEGRVESEGVEVDPDALKGYNMVRLDGRYDLPITESEVPVRRGAQVHVVAIEVWTPTARGLADVQEHFKETGYGGTLDMGDWKRYLVGMSMTAAAPITVYHGTLASNVDAIKREGLRPPPGVSEAGWPMLTTSKDQAARYMGGRPGAVVLEYRVPADKVWESGSDGAVLWPAESHGVYGFEAMAYGIKGSLPSIYLAAVHPIAKTGMVRIAKEEYQTGHQPSQAAPLYDLLEGDMLPDDMYEHPTWYTGFSELLGEVLPTLRKVRGKPDAMVTIYRSAPAGVAMINGGDWVSLSRQYALQHGMSNGEDDWPVYSAQVSARTVWHAGDDLMEWGYFGASVPARKI